MDASFGDWLAEKRGRRGEPGFVSQAELARRMGVDPTYVSQLEKRAKAPSRQTRDRIHAALGTTEDDLAALGIVGRPPRPVSPLSLVTPSPLARALDAIWQNMTDDQRAYAMNVIDAALAMPPARLGTVAADERTRRTP